jgi:Tol biopolymer transport system component
MTRVIKVAALCAALSATVALAGCADSVGGSIPALTTRAADLPQSAAAGVNFVFVRRDGTVSHIYLMHIDAAGKGSDLRRLTDDPQTEGNPVWSPDGRQILYTRDLDGSGIYVINADGTGQRRLSPVPGMDTTPDWSPDGTKIAFEWDINGSRQSDPAAFAQIWTINTDGTDPVSTGIQASAVGASPRWRPSAG